jgi:hypothetical protein
MYANILFDGPSQAVEGFRRRSTSAAQFGRIVFE